MRDARSRRRLRCKKLANNRALPPNQVLATGAHGGGGGGLQGTSMTEDGAQCAAAGLGNVPGAYLWGLEPAGHPHAPPNNYAEVPLSLFAPKTW